MRIKQSTLFGIRMIAGFQLLSALLIVLATDFNTWPDDLREAFTSTDFRFTIIAVGLAVVRPVTAIGLWRLKHWGWTMAMILTGLFLVSDLLSYASSYSGGKFTLLHFSMAINVIIVFYLNQTSVRRTFQGEPVSDE